MPMTEAELRAALRATFPPPEWFFLEEVRSEAGFGTSAETVRSADALAFNLWPSRGLEVVGFEVKTSRSDWARERQNPAKAETIARSCHRWYVVVPDIAVVADLPLPHGWGCLMPSPRKATLKIAMEAERRMPVDVSRPFLAAILRRAADSRVDTTALRAEYDRGVARGVASGKRARNGVLMADTERELRDAKRLRDAVDTFERQSGIKIHDSFGAGRQGDAIKRLLADDQAAATAEKRIGQLARVAREIAIGLERRVGGDA
jgi:hypothetical protein